MKRPLRRGFWFVAALLISTSVYFTIRYGLRPKPIPVMNPTQFEEPQQIGAVLFKRLRQEVRAERIVLLGTAVEWAGSEQVWNGFLKTALADHLKVDVVYLHEGLPAPESDLQLNVQTFSTAMVQSGEFGRQIEENMHAGRLVLVVDSTPAVTHLLPESLSRLLETVAHHPLLSLSLIPLSLRTDEVDSLHSECLQPRADFEGTAHLHCSEARVSKSLLKKKPLPAQTWSVIERHGLKEYLIFVKPPQSSAE